MSINVALCLFNLIPLAPLDGSGVLSGIVGEQGPGRWRRCKPTGLHFDGAVDAELCLAPVNILGRVLGGGVNAVMRLLLGA